MVERIRKYDVQLHGNSCIEEICENALYADTDHHSKWSIQSDYLKEKFIKIKLTTAKTEDTKKIT